MRPPVLSRVATHLAACGILIALPAQAALVITEAMSSSAPTATSDWFELTNTGTAPVDLAGYKFDDDSHDVAQGSWLAGISSIAPGESVVFLTQTNTSAAIAAFKTRWGTAFDNVRVGTYSGGSIGFGGSGDAVYVFDASSVELTGQTFGSATTGTTFRWDTNATTATNSTAGDAHGSVTSNGDTGSPGRTNGSISAPLQVASVTVSAAAADGFTLDWAAPASGDAPTGYVIELSANGFLSIAQTLTTDTTTHRVVTGLTASTTYSVRLRGVNTGGPGANAEFNATTLSGNTAPTFVGLTDGLYLSGVVGDADDYYAGANGGDVHFLVADAESAASSLTLTVSSSNPAVVPASGVHITNTNGNVSTTITPVGVGTTDLTLTLSDGSRQATRTLHYAASNSSTAQASTRWLSGRSDLSTAVRWDADTVLIADDEPSNVVLAYDLSRSGPPLARIALADGALGVNTGDNCEGISGAKCDGESDLEASVRLGSRVVWLGSHSNSKSGKIRPDRWRVFATDVTGSGMSTNATVAGYYKHLRTDLLAWDASNGHGLGANALGFTASAALNVAPEVATLDGFSMEGLSIGPDGTTGWLAFRAPLVAAPGAGAISAGSASNRTHALIVPVAQLSTLASAASGGTAGSATLGAPIRLNLGGRGIREIQRTGGGDYVILAGPPDAATGVAPHDFRLYTWDGTVDANGEATNLALRAADLTALMGGLGASYEGLVDVPAVLSNAGTVGLIADAGDVVYYGDGQVAKDLNDAWRKGRADYTALGAITDGRFRLSASAPVGGSIDSAALGVSCGALCTGDVPSGTVVVLTATPANGYTFSSWGGACSGSASTTCSLTVSAPTTVSANFVPTQSVGGSNPAGPGTLSATVAGGGSGTWAFTTTGNGPGQTAGFIPTTGHPKSPPSALPSGYRFPWGLFDFSLVGGQAGSSATVTVTYPDMLPADAVYWKYGPTPAGYHCSGAACAVPHWYVMPGVVFSGNTATFTITDGGVGDDDLSANGMIIDQGGPGIPVVTQAVPGLAGGALAALVALLGTLIAALRPGRRA